MQSKFERFLEEPGNRKLFEEESLAQEAAELVAQVMQEKGVSKAQLAQQLGKSKSHITQLLSGSRNMTLKTFAELLFVLGSRVEFKVAPLDRAERTYCELDTGRTRMTKKQLIMQNEKLLYVGAQMANLCTHLVIQGNVPDNIRAEAQRLADEYDRASENTEASARDGEVFGA